MTAPYSNQPSVHQLLDTEALSESEILFGQELLGKSVTQVTTSLQGFVREGTLYVVHPDAVPTVDATEFRKLAAVILVKPGAIENDNDAAHLRTFSNLAAAPLNLDLSLKRFEKLCRECEVPLLSVTGLGDVYQIADEVRMAFLRELKLSAARLHSLLLSTFLDDGLDAVLEEVGDRLNRPTVVETADFKVVASQNMGTTPNAQQKPLMDEALKALKRLQSSGEKSLEQSIVLEPIKLGRRLALPVVLNNSLVGFVSIMLRANDDQQVLGEYLQALALTAMVEFSQRRKDGAVFTVTQKTLLKDLLSGNSLSAADQERLERHYGFDMCDGFIVFAVEGASAGGGGVRYLPDDIWASTEIEGTRAFVLPWVDKNELRWQDEAEKLRIHIKSSFADKTEFRVQIGASRRVNSMPELSEAYREARQALIIGSMIHGTEEFVTGYGELGVTRLLYLIIDHPELERFYEEHLSPLESYDLEWESELVSSLRVYLQQGANLNSAARALFIHRHTLRYRLEQIADILKVDIDAQEVLLNLQIAFLIRDLKNNSITKGA